MKARNIDEPQGDNRGRLRRVANPKLARFADLVASGHSQAEAYRIAYKRGKMPAQDAAEFGWRCMQREGVKERVAALRAQSKGKTLLTLNDRLEILAGIAQDPNVKPGDKSRAIEVYSKISGDQAPDHHVHTGPDGGPIPVAGAVLVGTMSRREKLEAIRARRASA